MKSGKRLKNQLGKLIAGIALVCLTLPLPAFAGSKNGESKLGIRTVTDSTSGVIDRRGDLRIDFRADKEFYRVNEPISFSIKGNRTFFLYLFSISAEGEAVMLIPGPEQKGNKYKANIRHRVPNAGRDFFSDRPGSEQIILVASTRWLDPDTGQYNSKGGFYTASADVVAATVKGLRISSRKQQAGFVTREMSVRIGF